MPFLFIDSHKKQTGDAMSGNDGLRFVIDRRDGRYWWQFTELGQEYRSNRRYDTILDAASEADLYHRPIKLGRYFKANRLAASRSLYNRSARSTKGGR